MDASILMESKEVDFSRVRVQGRQRELQQLAECLNRVESAGCNVCDDNEVDRNPDNNYQSSVSYNGSEEMFLSLNNSTETILLEGASGCGKSSLLGAFRDHVHRRRPRPPQSQSQTTAAATQETQPRPPQHPVYFGLGHYEESVNNPFAPLLGAVNELLENALADQSMNWEEIAAQEMDMRDFVGLIMGPCPAMRRLFPAGHLAGKRPRGERRDSFVGTKWTFQQLRFALRTIFRMITARRVVVLVMDDVQWADDASFSIIESIVLDRGMKNLMLVVSYRPLPEHLQKDHVVTRFRARLETMKERAEEVRQSSARSFHAVQFWFMKIQPLDVDAICDILVAVTDRFPHECRELAQVLKHRTDGNAFFLLQFLRRLNEIQLLYYSGHLFQWEWDLQKIVADTSISDNVLDMVTHKIQDLPMDLQTALISASCVGPAHFDVHMLARLHMSVQGHRSLTASSSSLSPPPSSLENPTDAEQAPTDAFASEEEEEEEVERLNGLLEVAIREGLVERIGKTDSYKFTHDRIRESARALLPTTGNEALRIHLNIGRALRTASEEQFHELPHSLNASRMLLLAVDYLNTAKMVMKSDEEFVDLVGLNERAAAECFRGMAMMPAKRYLRESLAILDMMDGWKKHYKLSLRIKTFLVRVLFCGGELEECDNVIDSILEKVHAIDDSLTAYRYKVHCLVQFGQSNQAVDLIISLVRRLGFFLPTRGWRTKLFILRTLFKIRLRMPFFSEERLLNLPKVTDERVLQVCDFFELMVEVGSSLGDITAHSLGIVSLINATLVYGYTKHCALAISSYGILCASFGNYHMADSFGRMALRILSEHDPDSPSGVFAVIGVSIFLYHWKHPLQESLEKSIQAKHMVLRSGLYQNLFFSFMSYTMTYLMCGLALDPLYEDVIKLHEILVDLHMYHYVSLFEAPVQYIMNLMGKAEDPLVLTGSIMNQEHRLRLYREKKNDRAMQMLHTFRMFLAYYFDDIDLALEMTKHTMSTSGIGPSPLYCTKFLFHGLIFFAAAKKTGKRMYKRQGRACLRKLEGILQKGCVNVHHQVLLLRAECLTLSPRNSALIQPAFDEAITSAGKLGFTHNHALANELAGSYYYRQEDFVWAATYLSRALSLYDAWGALAKVAHMQKKYRTVLAQSQTSRFFGSSGVQARQRFSDVASVYSSAESISLDTDDGGGSGNSVCSLEGSR